MFNNMNKFAIIEEDLIDGDYARFNVVITSLKALDEYFSSKNYVRKFLRGLHLKLRPKVAAIEKSKDLSSLSRDELIGNLKVYEMVKEKDFEIIKGKNNKYKSKMLLRRKQSSEDETQPQEVKMRNMPWSQELLEYMGVHDNDASEISQPSWGKNVYIWDLVDFDVTISKLEYKFQDHENLEDIFNFGSAMEDFILLSMYLIGTLTWSDSGEDDEEPNKDKVCLMVQESNEEIQRPEGRDKTRGAWKNKGSKASGSSSVNRDALARLMVAEMTAQEKEERLAFLKIEIREVECHEREIEQQDMRFYLQPYDHLTGDQRNAMDEISKFINDVKLAKSLYTTNYDQLYAYLSQHERHANEVRITRERYPYPFAFVANSPTLYNPSQSPQHSQREDPIECINKAMAFLYAVAARFLPSNNQLRTSSNPRNQATIQDGRFTVQQVQERQNQSYACTGNRGIATTLNGNVTTGSLRVMKCYNCQGKGHMARQCTQPTKECCMVPYSDSYPNDMINQDVQEMQYSEQTYVDDFRDNEIHSGSNIIPVIAKEHVLISVLDDEETLILEEDSRSKMLDKQRDPILIEKKIKISPIDYSKLNKIKEDFRKCFVTQKNCLQNKLSG
nr:UBN2 domain-containing protein [Tanacetum cinerariifolium]